MPDGRRVQIASDDAAGAAELERRLTALGYDAATVVPTAQALSRRLEMPPELVLLDVAPGDVGPALTAFDEIVQRRYVPVVLRIAEADEPTLRRMDGGARDYVVEPCTDRELRGALELAFCRHEAAGRVREAGDRFFETSIDLLCFLDFDGYFKRLNPAWERTLGFTRAELMSRPFIEFVHPDDRERTLAQNARVRAGGQALAFENRYLCKDGSFRWLHWNAAPDEMGGTIYSMARDITAKKRADEEREELVRELQSALAEVSALRRILPICSYCRKIRDDENYWHTVEAYLSRHTTTLFSHGICPTCMATHWAEFGEDV